MGKKALCLIFAFLLSINSFAAVVSDNDGSAFITKAEFDSLKNDFQSALNSYNSNIDAKIDNAIAQYLSGIKVEKYEEVALPLKDWKTITMINGILKPEFTYPSINGNVLLEGGFGTYKGDSRIDNTWINSYWAYCNAVYNQDTTKTSTRPTVKNVKEDGTDEKYMTWDGVKCNWVEKISATMPFWDTDNLYAFEVSGITNKFFLYQLACFSGYGYNANLSSKIAEYWKAGYGYYSNYGTYGYNSFSKPEKLLSPSLVFTINTEGKKYEHICNWTNTFKNWEVYNENFVNSQRNSLYDNLLANDWYTSMSTSGKWYGEKAMVHNTTSLQNRIKAKWKDLEISNKQLNQSASSYYIPRIGLYSSDVQPISILQTVDEYTQVVDNKKHVLPILNLIEGVPILYAKKDDEIQWNPEFENLSSSETGVVTGNEEICLMLSIKPFWNSWDTQGAGEADLIAVSNFGSETLYKYPLSINKQFKLKFTMPEDGFVYAKWFPNLSDDITYIDGKNWQVDLDLISCGSYTRKIAKDK